MITTFPGSELNVSRLASALLSARDELNEQEFELFLSTAMPVVLRFLNGTGTDELHDELDDPDTEHDDD